MSLINNKYHIILNVKVHITVTICADLAHLHSVQIMYAS